jgi:3,4-dihydroxy 2-butanone 4-phosphate synthase/GTP cyclohydrolase II
VLERGGHTEASVDLCLLAKMTPVAVICELMNPTGSMMTRDKCFEFARLHGLPIITVRQIVQFRQQMPQGIGPTATSIAAAAGVQPLAPLPAPMPPAGASQWDRRLVESAVCDLPVRITPERTEVFKLRIFRSTRDDTEHFVLTKGDVAQKTGVLTRVHSECFTAHVLHSMRCDCQNQWEESLRLIADVGTGVLIYLRGHEGRGIGITNKVRAYHLQQTRGLDTYQANVALDLPVDSRDFSDADAILSELHVTSIQVSISRERKKKKKKERARERERDGWGKKRHRGRETKEQS